MEERKLNHNDKKLLIFCEDRKRSIREIAEHLGIAAKNVSVRIGKLEKMKLINVEKKGLGKKTLIRTKSGDKTKQHFITILKEIKKRGGSVSEKEYATILPVDFSDPKEHDKFNAISLLLYTYPSLVDRRIFLTEEGEKFLKENSRG